MRSAFVTFVVFSAFAIGFGCAHLTAQDRTELGEYDAQQSACIAAHKPDKAAIDACRAQVKQRWCGQWGARFDGGVCQ